MDIGRYIRHLAKYMLGPAIGLSLSAYFGYHLMEGDRGFFAWMRLTQQIRETQRVAAEIHQERDIAERRTSLLRPEHLDPDMLDEQARMALNLVGPGEVVIPNPDHPK